MLGSVQCALARFLAILFFTGAFAWQAAAQSAPGVLPWALPGAAADGKKSDSKKEKRGRNRDRSNRAGQGTLGFRGAVPVQELHGSVSLGLESAGSRQGNLKSSSGGRTYRVALQGQGFLLHPQLWTHELSLQWDRLGLGADTRSQVTGGLGLRFNGVLLGGRSFPLRIFVARRRTDSEFSDLAGLHSSFGSQGISWSLRHANLPSLTLTAQSSNSSNDFGPVVSGFQERQRSVSAGVAHSLWGWQLAGSADLSRVRSTLSGGFDYDLGTVEFRAERPWGESGTLASSVRKTSRSESGRPGSNQFGFTAWQTSLTYRHTPSLNGSYSVSYLSNLRESFVFSALQLSQGRTAPREPTSAVEPGAALREAFTTSDRRSSFNGQAGWSYVVTPNLSVNFHVGRSQFTVPETTAQAEVNLLTSYSRMGAGLSYSRSLGRWETRWRFDLSRSWNGRRSLPGYADDNRNLGVQLRRQVGRWDWTSDVSHSQYSSAFDGGTLYRNQRWANEFSTLLPSGVRLNLGGEIFRVDSRFRELSAGAHKGLLLHAMLNGRRWNATFGRGLRQVRSTVVLSDPTDLLSTAVLEQVDPSIRSLTSADRYTYAMGRYSLGRNLALQGAYRTHNFRLPSAGFNRSADLDLSATYQLRLVNVSAGYRRLEQETDLGRFQRGFTYVRVMRPFRVF